MFTRPKKWSRQKHSKACLCGFFLSVFLSFISSLLPLFNSFYHSFFPSFFLSFIGRGGRSFGESISNKKRRHLTTQSPNTARPTQFKHAGVASSFLVCSHMNIWNTWAYLLAWVLNVYLEHVHVKKGSHAHILNSNASSCQALVAISNPSAEDLKMCICKYL